MATLQIDVTACFTLYEYNILSKLKTKNAYRPTHQGLLPNQLLKFMKHVLRVMLSDLGIQLYNDDDHHAIGNIELVIFYDTEPIRGGK